MRFFTTAEWAALPAECKATEERVMVIARREVKRRVNLYLEPGKKAVLAIVSDNPPITEVRG